MNITEWINSGADYDTGLVLYGKQPRHNKNLLRLFIRKKQQNKSTKIKIRIIKIQKE